eukprot:TRINITY_DN2321_c0_g2_i1.p1 TRINITY_DN2321_c0_g2~~TRINITY_DN2321_c0_g2_i1.p1  ORF type:complete len:2019 (-),score=403.92 TRINITY_DN2321_c0_g2_i1:828-6884(-)
MKTMANLTDSLVGHLKKVNQILISLDRKSIYSSSEDGTIRNWDYNRALELDRYAYILTDSIGRGGAISPGGKGGDGSEGKAGGGPSNAPPTLLALIPERNEITERVILLSTAGSLITVFETYPTPSLLAETTELVTMIQKTSLGTSHPYSLIALSQDNSFSFFDDQLLEVYDEVVVSSSAQHKKESGSNGAEEGKLNRSMSTRSLPEAKRLNREVISFLHLEEYDLLLMGTNTGGIEYIQPRSAEYGEDVRRHLIAGEDAGYSVCCFCFVPSPEELQEKKKKNKSSWLRQRKATQVGPALITGESKDPSKDGKKSPSTRPDNRSQSPNTRMASTLAETHVAQEGNANSKSALHDASVGNLSSSTSLPSSQAAQTSAEPNAQAEDQTGAQITQRKLDDPTFGGSTARASKNDENTDTLMPPSASMAESLDKGKSIDGSESLASLARVSSLRIPENIAEVMPESASANPSSRTATESVPDGSSLPALPRVNFDSRPKPQGETKSELRVSPFADSNSKDASVEGKNEGTSTTGAPAQKTRKDAFLTATNEGVIYYWPLTSIKELSSSFTTQHQKDVIIDMVYVSQFDVVVTACINGTIDFLDPVTLAVKTRFSCMQEGLSCFHIVETGYIACGFETGNVELWKFKVNKDKFSFKFKKSITAHADKVTSLAWVTIDLTRSIGAIASENEPVVLHLLLSASADQSLKVWDSSQLRLIRTMSLNGIITQVQVFYEEGEVVVAVANTIKVISLVDIIKTIRQKAIAYAKEFKKVSKEDVESFNQTTPRNWSSKGNRESSPTYGLDRRESEITMRFDATPDRQSEASVSQSPSMMAIMENVDSRPKLGIVPSFIPKLNEPDWKKDDAHSDSSQDTVEWLEDVELNRLRQLEYEDTPVFSSGSGLKLQQSSFLKKERPVSILMMRTEGPYEDQEDDEEQSEEIGEATIDSDTLSLSSRPSRSDSASLLSREEWDDPRPLEKPRPIFDSLEHNRRKTERGLHSIRLDPLPGKKYKPKPLYLESMQKLSYVLPQPKKQEDVLRPCNLRNKNLNVELDLDVTLDRLVYDTLHHRIPILNQFKFVKGDEYDMFAADSDHVLHVTMEDGFTDEMSFTSSSIPGAEFAKPSLNTDKNPKAKLSPVANTKVNKGEVKARVDSGFKSAGPSYYRKGTPKMSKRKLNEKQQMSDAPAHQYDAPLPSDYVVKVDIQMKHGPTHPADQTDHAKDSDNVGKPQRPDARTKGIIESDENKSLQQSSERPFDAYPLPVNGETHISLTDPHISDRSYHTKIMENPASWDRQLGPPHPPARVMTIPNDQGFMIRAVSSGQTVFDRGLSRSGAALSRSGGIDPNDTIATDASRAPIVPGITNNVKVIIRRSKEGRSTASIFHPSGLSGVSSVAARPRDDPDNPLSGLLSRRKSTRKHSRYERIILAPTNIRPPDGPTATKLATFSHYAKPLPHLSSAKSSPRQAMLSITAPDARLPDTEYLASPDADHLLEHRSTDSVPDPVFIPPVPERIVESESPKRQDIVFLPDDLYEPARIPSKTWTPPTKRMGPVRAATESSFLANFDLDALNQNKEQVAKVEPLKTHVTRRRSIDFNMNGPPHASSAPEMCFEPARPTTPPSLIPEAPPAPSIPIPALEVASMPLSPPAQSDAAQVENLLMPGPIIIEASPINEAETIGDSQPKSGSAGGLEAPEQSWKSFLRRQSRQYQQPEDISTTLLSLQAMETFQEEPNSPPVSTPSSESIPEIAVEDEGPTGRMEPVVHKNTESISQTMGHIQAMMTAKTPTARPVSREVKLPSMDLMNKLMSIKTETNTPSASEGEAAEETVVDEDMQLVLDMDPHPPPPRRLRRNKSLTGLDLRGSGVPSNTPCMSWTGAASVDDDMLLATLKRQWLATLTKPYLKSNKIRALTKRSLDLKPPRCMSCGDFNVFGEDYSREPREKEGFEGTIGEYNSSVSKSPSKDDIHAAMGHGASSSTHGPTKGSPAKRKEDNSKKAPVVITPKQIAETKYTYFQIDDKLLARLMRGEW